jgi:hypothetical protein
MEPLMTALTIDGLNRDLLKNGTIVTLKWKDDPEKRLGLIVTGQLRALGVTPVTRVEALPDVPPIAESVPGY